ncbi:carnitine transporter [Cladochytrium tenue]|nr:carnitine transporter [Cladochytrium tenue]
MQRPTQPAPPPPTFLFGAIGGVSGVLVSHPFDLLKVRLQSGLYGGGGGGGGNSGSSSSSRGGSYTRRLVAVLPRRPAALYQGVGPVLVGAAPVMGLSYFSFSHALNGVAWLSGDSSSSGGGSSSGGDLRDRLPIAQVAAAGAFAALPTALLLGPAERVKIILQLRPSPDPSSSSSSTKTPPRISLAAPWRALRDTTVYVVRALAAADPASRSSRSSSSGGSRAWLVARGLFRGTGATAARDVPGDAAFFGVFEAVKRGLAATFPPSSSSAAAAAAATGGSPAARPVWWQVLLAGGLAGCANWLVCLPLDAIKTRLQQDRLPSSGTRPHPAAAAAAAAATGRRRWPGSAYTQAAAALVAERGGGLRGLAGLYRGLGPTLARAFPSAAAFFGGVEAARAAWGHFGGGS